MGEVIGPISGIGYSAEEDYDAMGTYDAGREDIDNTIDTIKMTKPNLTADKDSVYYLTYQSGSSNKFHCFLLLQDKSGSWFAMNGAARIGYSPQVHRIAGPTSMEQARGALHKKMRTKERKGYSIMFSPSSATKWYKSAETYGAEMDYMELPVIPDSYGTDSATEMGGRGVPVWYGSAESKTGGTAANYIFDHDNYLEGRERDLERDRHAHEQTLQRIHDGRRKLKDDFFERAPKKGLPTDSTGKPVVDYSPLYETARWETLLRNGDAANQRLFAIENELVEIQLEREGLANVHLGAEGMEMTPDIEGYPGLPVIPDSYGTNSALESGQGVPVWYGSAEETNPECGFCGSEEAYSSQYGTFCIPCATIVGEIVETHFTPGRRNPAGMIPRYSKDAEGANPSGGSTGNQVVSWESGGLSSPSGPPSDIFWADAEWSEADAAHSLLRRKAKKQRTIDRKKARRQKYSAEGERIRSAGELVDYIDTVWNGSIPTGGPFTIPPYLEVLVAPDLQEMMRSDDELDLLFRDGSMATCIYDARSDTLNTFVVAYDGDITYNSESFDENEDEWDYETYEHKDFEIVKPFGTAMKATMGIAAGTAAVVAITIGLLKLGEMK